ncbi:hypothetical protein HN51_007774 [Arachis hypogaea]
MSVIKKTFLIGKNVSYYKIYHREGVGIFLRSHQYVTIASWVGRGIAGVTGGGASEIAPGRATMGGAVDGGDVIFVVVNPEKLVVDPRSRTRETGKIGVLYLF